jgi:hypothetical protein
MLLYHEYSRAILLKGLIGAGGVYVYYKFFYKAPVYKWD